jgi:hypothetical protein
LINRFFTAAIVLSILQSVPAMSLVYREIDGLFLYYPKSEEQIAARLLKQFHPFKDFLERQGLPLTYPLHVILDGELDQPRVNVVMIPHREIRIPIRAPGVLEDGYLESDPWTYFLFKGLCLQGIYGNCSGIPDAAHKIFGDAISPNKVLPAWIKEGICQLLYKIYTGKRRQDPYYTALFKTTALPDIDDVSHRPEKWPGQNNYLIFGVPFIDWIYERFGWELILKFIQLHGEGLVPFEIDMKAREIFGNSYTELWNMFRLELVRQKPSNEGLNITGYWPEPIVYWNLRGIYPGVERLRSRGRYGFMTKNNDVRLSEYERDGRVRLYEYRGTTPLVFGADHIWDPGPGDVAISRQGHRNVLVMLPQNQNLWLKQIYRPKKLEAVMIPAPPGVLGMSGPVKADDGRIALATNLQGNWDIWVYKDQWRRVTSGPSIEMDPWWQNGRLVFASNVSGRFQIHAADMRQITDCPTVAVMPRQDAFLCLAPSGWRITNYETYQLPEVRSVADQNVSVEETGKPENLESETYTPLKSIWPNYFKPDGFVGNNDVQIGVVTSGRDVSKKYRVDAGLRYSFDLDYLSMVLGGGAKDFGLRFSRYPISYTPKLGDSVDESRHEVRISWQPFGIEEIEISASGQWYDPLHGSGESGDEFWGALGLRKALGRHRGWINLDLFDDNSQSLFGGFNLFFW